MGVPSSPGHAPKRTAASNSIGFYFNVGLIGPVTLMLLLWGAVAGVVLSGALARMSWLASVAPGHRALVEASVVTGSGLVVVLVTVILIGRFARRVSRDADALAAAARHLADERLPQIVEALRSGERVAQEAAAAPLPQVSVAEIAVAAAALARLHYAAVASAAAEAGLRSGFRQILASLGRRNQSLLHRQLTIIDALEQQASSPAALAELFALDHLTTRMRRHAESLTILSGAAPGRSLSGPVSVVDVMRAAAAEVEDYTRVAVSAGSQELVATRAVTDMIHLLAELIENATMFSPSSTRVEVRAERVANGLAIEVEDRGLGMPPDQLRELNSQLAEPPDFDLADADRLGLFVAGRLAARHGVHVSLGPSQYLGTKAVVVLPDAIVTAAAVTEASSIERTLRDSAQLNLRAPGVLSLAGAVVTGSAAADAVGSTATRPEQPPPSTRNGLPRRVRPDSKQPEDPAPQTRGTSPLPRRAAAGAPQPEAARSLAASLQNSWHKSRQPDDSTAGERPATWRDAVAPGGAADSAADSAPDSEEALWL